MYGKREYGDYQTPPDFAARVCRFLKEERHIEADTILEPTCGTGSFLRGSLIFEAKRYFGIERNYDYCCLCSDISPRHHVEIYHADIFQYRLEAFRAFRKLLVIGNPPWVNNSTLSTLHSDNVPMKSNFKHLSGMDAMTGAGNFDICEAILLRLIHAFQNTDTVIAMLCKTSVARNIFQELKREQIAFSHCEIVEFDCVKVFGVNVSACLLIIRLSMEHTGSDLCRISSLDHRETDGLPLIYRNGRLYRGKEETGGLFDGKCCFEWRQGVKHDCANVMELTANGESLVNGNQEQVDIERNLVFPLVKSSMIKTPLISSFHKYVIVTQKAIREDTRHIEKDFPKTWRYLQRNRERFERRRSIVYQGTPPFSMFGIGEYSYAKYKVCVSGFYKEPRFSLLFSPDGKAVMTDDTAYFLPFSSYDMAYMAMLMLNAPQVQSFLKQIAFPDSKRPYTKKVLARVDFAKMDQFLTNRDLEETERRMGLAPYLTPALRRQFSLLPEICGDCAGKA